MQMTSPGLEPEHPPEDNATEVYEHRDPLFEFGNKLLSWEL